MTKRRDADDFKRDLAKSKSGSTARKDYVKRIKTALGKAVASFIEAGDELIKAKNDTEMKHGQFEEMVTKDLGMSISKAERLMTIAEHPVLSKSAHGPILPPSWRTLYELTKMPVPRLEAKLKDGTINPQMERKDVADLLPKRRGNGKSKDTSSDPIEEPCDDCSTPEEEWQRSLSNLAGDAISLEAYWSRQFGTWRKFKATSQLVTLARQAAEAWENLASIVNNMET